MRPPDDTELLTAYATRHSEEAFTELVGRHVALVYSAALRQVREPQLAEDVTQAVFIILARKARAVSRHTALSGWLCRVAHFVSRDALRAERRRQHREQIVARMESSADTDWMQIAPLLDEVVAQLSEKDRSAIVLRFYEQKSFGEVGSVLGVDADAAQKRVSRALEKLRIIFAKRGVNSTTAIIAGAISANSVQAAPVALAKSVTAIAVAKGATAGGSTLTLIKGASKIMAWTKAKTAIVGGVVVLLASGTTTITVKVIQEHRTYSWQNPPAYGNELDEVPPQVRIVPSKYSAFGECSRNGKILGLGTRVADILAAAYGVAPAHVFFSTGAPPGEFDFIANLANDNEQALQKEVKSKFGLVGRTEVRGTDVLLLKVKDAAKLQSHIFKDRYDFEIQRGLQYGDAPLSSVVAGIELLFEKPVVDATGRSGNYHLQFLAGEFSGNEIKWSSIESRIESLRQTLTDELDQDGLELVPTNMPIEMLVVEKVK